MTSIAVKESTKKELLNVVSYLQSKYGRKIDYDEAIQYLLSQRRIKRPDLLKKACNEEQCADEFVKELIKERRKDNERY